ncbi:OLC1v1003940C1 [Oldenlandia corymbosa var. corymbosa]|uniref:OLC1v1003940C1 n=1 Tax=Oldenlandia corymbosa var. corymbosa TaxID=529605 RepID=A0AAV1DB31_OLDCO|nr:OLC1v1003940C1 [Oldenlandia corymbosa var. corymbosa]
MAKGMMQMKAWMEVAPSLLVVPVKPSHCPKLETIREDGAEEGHDDNDDGS